MFEAEFEDDICQSKVNSLRCVTCRQCELKIKSLKNFILKWLSPDATTINKDTVKKLCLFIASRSSEAVVVVEKTLTGQSLKSICDSDCKSLSVKFNCAYYLAKHERP